MLRFTLECKTLLVSVTLNPCVCNTVKISPSDSPQLLKVLVSLHFIQCEYHDSTTRVCQCVCQCVSVSVCLSVCLGICVTVNGSRIRSTQRTPTRSFTSTSLLILVRTDERTNGSEPTSRIGSRESTI